MWVWESSDGWLFAYMYVYIWAFYECVLIRSSTLQLLPFTLVTTSNKQYTLLPRVASQPAFACAPFTSP